MDGYRQRLVGRHRWRQFSCGIQTRTAALICLLAFTLSLTTPIVHMWEVAAPRHTASGDGPSTFSLLVQTGDAVVLTSPGEAARSVPHDAALCPVCKGLARVRQWLVTQVTAVGAPKAQAWCHPAAVVYAAPIILLALAPRAPPYTS